MTFVIVMGFHQIIVVMNDVKWHTYIQSLLQATDETCRWTKRPARHSQTWWWNDEVDQCINEKRRLWKEWKSVGSKNLYLEAKHRARTAVYAAKAEAERNIFADVLRREDQRNEVFKIANQMKKTNQDAVGEKCIRNDEGNLASTEEEKKLAWKSHYEKLLNTEFHWDRDSLSEVHPVEGPAMQIKKEWVEEEIRKMKNGKAAGMSDIDAEMVKASGDTGIEIITNLANQIMKDGVNPQDWQSSVIVNCFKGKGDALERGNYRGLKLVDQVMKVIERVIDKLLRERIDIDEMQFCFLPGRGTTDAIFLLRQL